MRKAKLFAHWIDTVNTWVGQNTSYLLLPLMLFAIIEVIMRYVFNRPTLWAWDVNVQLMAAFVAMTLGYSLLCGRFVIVDVVIGHLSPRTRAIIDLNTSVIIFFTTAVLTWLAATRAWDSLLIRETYVSTWEPPLYPLRIIIAVGLALLFFQVVSRFIHTLSVFTGDEKGS